MTTAEIVQLFHGRRSGKGKWRSKCPSHGSRGLTLVISERRDGSTGVYCHAGCAAKDVMASVGLSLRDLFLATKIDPEIRRRMRWEEERKALNRQLGLVIMLGAVERDKRNYWHAAERRIRGEIDELRCRLEPEKVCREYQLRAVNARIEKYGMDQLWKEIYGN